jgi:hypothetical protein
MEKFFASGSQGPHGMGNQLRPSGHPEGFNLLNFLSSQLLLFPLDP